jgi:hypothetical protein
LTLVYRKVTLGHSSYKSWHLFTGKWPYVTAVMNLDTCLQNSDPRSQQLWILTLVYRLSDPRSQQLWIFDTCLQLSDPRS